MDLMQAEKSKESSKNYVLNEKSSNTTLTDKKIRVRRTEHSIAQKYYLQVHGV